MYFWLVIMVENLMQCFSNKKYMLSLKLCQAYCMVFVVVVVVVVCLFFLSQILLN